MTLVEQLVRFIRQHLGQIDPVELAEVLAVEGDDQEPAPLMPGEPTQYPPGSPGKIAIMAERAARGEALFHPLDRKGTGTTQRKEDTSARPPKVRKAVLPRGVTPFEDDWTV